MTGREAFMTWVNIQARNSVVLWRGKGWFLFSADHTPPLIPHGHTVPAYDCSGLVTCGLHAVMGIDLRASHNARLLAMESAAIDPTNACAGDLVFYGTGTRPDGTPNIEHVAISLGFDDGRVLSADGATSHQQDFDVAANSRACRIRLHEGPHFRGDYLAIHKNKWLEAKHDPGSI